MSNTIAPEYIARDTHAGRHWFAGRTGARRTDVFTAAELAAMCPATGPDGEFVLFEVVELANNRRMYKRTRFIADADGALHGYTSDGARVIIHPADRKLRILTV